MKIIDSFDFSMKKTAVTLGNFDGFHMGHRRLIKEVTASGYRSVIFTFSPHPVSFFGGKGSFRTIFTDSEKISIAEGLEADVLVRCPFTRELADLSPYEFFDLLIEKTDCRLLVTGDNYTFGKNKAGTPELLASLGEKKGIDVRIIPSVEYNGERVSSSAIREYISKGDIKKANLLLQTEYFISGNVVRGRHIGTDMGFPTANISVSEQKLLPCDGVYAASAKIDGKTYPAVTNIGRNPTFHNLQRTVETHVLNCRQNLYGKDITVAFTERIRDEQRFDSKNELVLQIRRDIERAYDIFSHKTV